MARLPDFASGFWQSKLRYVSQEELMGVAHEYRKRGLPLSVIVADFFHWPHQGDWKFDKDYWPDPKAMVDELKAKKMEQNESGSLEQALPQTDVLYVTRVQKERFEDPAVYEKVKGAYVIDAATMKAAKEHMIVMHPLPRVTEISMDFDEDPRAAYFRQMEYGLYVRMALLAMVLGKA